MTKTAKEMFEKLGFEEVDGDQFSIITYADKRKGEKVMFDPLVKGFSVSYGDDVSPNELKNGDVIITGYFHQAIHQQMKELGWLDE